ncbi:hypothetical protein A3Q56_08021 [Intoshia linei]|uniref:Alpha-carbonic anhydrase domain-containing protein n=1 Tax=Intoshia linei TaxID=1819745 RepID=A0A177AQL8_9BILA|nr:hypothetical protein A3Q56_08021 [Intoshia linei]
MEDQEVINSSTILRKSKKGALSITVKYSRTIFYVIVAIFVIGIMILGIQIYNIKHPEFHFDMLRYTEISYIEKISNVKCFNVNDLALLKNDLNLKRNKIQLDSQFGKWPILKYKKPDHFYSYNAKASENNDILINLNVNGKGNKYCIVNFHYIANDVNNNDCVNLKGSDHSINNIRSLAEINIILKNKKYNLIGEATKKIDGIIMISILIDLKKENKEKANSTYIDLIDFKEDVDVYKFLPVDKSYYAYSEYNGIYVNRIVLKNQIEMTAEEIKKIKIIKYRTNNKNKHVDRIVNYETYKI